MKSFVMGICIIFAVECAQALASENDHFAHRTPLPSEVLISTSGRKAEATTELSEPFHNGLSDQNEINRADTLVFWKSHQLMKQRM